VTEKKSLSATKIKTLQGCSWQYFAKYHLKLPEKQNLGASLGNIAHIIFECLGNPRHLKHYKKALKTKNIYKIESIRRLVKKYFQKYGIIDKEEALKLNSWVICGLGYDFFGKTLTKPDLALSEQDFDINMDEDGKSYRIKGFIDKLFLYKKKSLALIRDFKTSKKSFDGKDLEDNLQDQIYALAVSKLYPDFMKIKVEFPFLQLMVKNGEDAVVKMQEQSVDDLENVEFLLTEIQKCVDNFSEKDASSNLAAYKGYPEDGSFSGKLLCGFDNKKGQLKKDGTPMWGCAFKWGFEYYSVKNKKGEIISTYLLDDFDKIDYDEEKGEEIFLEKYEGCPAWKNK